jgi:hypothetical protein
MTGEWKLVGTLGVDSGQMMLCDPCYIKKDFANEYGETNQKDMTYSGACNATLGNDGFGFLTNTNGYKLAFACSSGYGDGVYPVYIKRDGGRIAEMKIVFIGNMEDHEDEEDDC